MEACNPWRPWPVRRDRFKVEVERGAAFGALTRRAILIMHGVLIDGLCKAHQAWQ